MSAPRNYCLLSFDQVRRMIAVMCKVARGTLALARLQEMVEHPERDITNRENSVFPPQGLHLVHMQFKHGGKF